jgi:transcriptional regulator with XRE-family HTH domain
VTDYSFGARLRHERERRGIALASIAERTKIAPALLVALERGDVGRWPGGIYRRSFIRAYAEAVGLDPAEVAREFFESFPDPAAVAPTIAGVAEPSPDAARAPAPTAAKVRLRLDQPPPVCRPGRLLADGRQRVGAAAVDLATLLIIATAFSAALGDFWMPLAIAMACYYVGGILIFGNTPGVCLFAALASDVGDRTTASHDSHASASAPRAM